MELTEFEESVSFDLDDPDFAPPAVPRTTAHGVFRGMKFAAEIALNVNKCEFALQSNIDHNIILHSSTRFPSFDRCNSGVTRGASVSSGANTVHGSNMSVTSVQNTTENLSRHGSNISLSCHSLCGSVDESLGSHPQYQDTILTIEELRAQLNSCFTCGVSWSEEHVSLDCSECGGYSLQRPCPLCDGRCHAVWKRDLTMSHASGKARWIGECALSCGPTLEESLVPALEKLRATS